MAAAPGVTDVGYSDGVPLGFEPSWWEDLKHRGLLAAPGREHEDLPQCDFAGLPAANAHSHSRGPQLYRTGQ